MLLLDIKSQVFMLLRGNLRYRELLILILIIINFI